MQDAAAGQRPDRRDGVVDHSVGRLLDLFDIDTGNVCRWQGGKRER